MPGRLGLDAQSGWLALPLVLALLIGLDRLGLTERLDLLAFDHLAPIVASGDPLVVIVEIDQESLERLGQWPWPRRLHADLIERLAVAGPAVIGYDVLFAEPSRTEAAGDAALAAAVAAAGNVVLPMIAEAPSRGAPPLEIVPFVGLGEHAAAIGHSHLVADGDGRLRRLLLRAGVSNAFWPSFAGAVHEVAARTAGTATSSTDTASVTPVPKLSPETPLALGWVAEDAILVPMSASESRRLHVSAWQIVAGLQLAELADAIVMVAATARGLQSWVDIGPSGGGSLVPAVDFNAFAVQALMQGRIVVTNRNPALAASLLAGAAFLPWLGSLLLGLGAAGRRQALALAPLLPLAIGLATLAGFKLLLPFASVCVAIALVLLATELAAIAIRMHRVRHERSLAHAALTRVADGVLTTDRTNRIDYANRAAERLLAPPNGALIGRRLESVAPQLMQLLRDNNTANIEPPEPQPSFYKGQPSRHEHTRNLPITAADGSKRLIKAAVCRRGDGWREGHVIALNDITDEQRLLDEVAFRATHDGLTKLPNRHLLIDRLTSAIERARRHQRLVGAVFLDVDRLKSINDALGHAVGDAVLVEVASRLTTVGRSTDTVGRHGGDEFVLLLEDLASRSEVEAGVDRYRQCLKPPVIIGDRRFAIKASIGVACFPLDADGPEDLLRRADVAMYRAKAAGRDQVVFYDAALHGQETSGLLLDDALRQGIARDELELHYQPRIDLACRQPSGIESLVRWRHPEQGFLPPGRFIGLAEETGSIVELGRWVLAKACADLAGPRLRHSGLRLSINVSVVQLKRDQTFVDFVRGTLERHHLNPDQLELEITESLFLDPSLPMLGRKLAELAALGVHLSIDDFGTGYSSLAYINRFPFDRIKIDRSFVHAVGREKGAQAIIRAIVGLSKSLAKKTTAEGVEEIAQLAFLDELDCNEAQGYLFGRPVPLAELMLENAA